MFGFIYITTNLINGKKYLGQCRYGKPTTANYLGSGKALKRAILKYGRENFSREIILECETREDLIDAEIRLITEYDCVNSPTWYNIASGGYITRGFRGKVHTAESNEKRSAKLRGRSRPPHVGEAVSKAQKGRPKTDGYYEGRKKIIGSNHPRAQCIEIDGVTYPTHTAARKSLNLTYEQLHRKINGVAAKSPPGNPKPITINNTSYSSMKEACERLNIGMDRLRTIVRKLKS